MSFKEVKEYRKNGKLEEALQMAQQDLAESPDDIWNKRSISWVYYEYLKRDAYVENYQSFKENLENIKNLELPEAEKMIFDKIAYQIGKIVFALTKVEPIEYRKINELFDIIKEFHFTQKSEAYSFLFKAFHKGYKEWSRFLEFADWWGFENFRSEDFLPEEFEGKEMNPLVELAYIAYSKKLLEGSPSNNPGEPPSIDRDKISTFLPKLEALIEEHPEFEYPPYYIAKCLLQLDDNENALSAFIPFAKSRKNDFWVWEILSETYTEDDDKRLACLCKAVSIKTKEDFLVKVRQKLAKQLILHEKFQEAKTEIEIILKVREENGWGTPNIIKSWTRQEWYNTTEALSDNNKLYSQHTRVAEEILFSDIPEEIVAVEFVNKNRHILNFVKDQEKHGYFKYKGQIDHPQIGDILKVRFNGFGSNGFYKTYTIKKTDEECDCPAIKEFSGTFIINEPNTFGFVDDIFVDPEIVKSNNLQQNQEVNGKAILSFNKKKKEWGWKVIEVK